MPRKNKSMVQTVYIFSEGARFFLPRCGNDVIVPGYVSKTTVLRHEVDAVGSSSAGNCKILQQGHKNDKKLHTSQRLANTGSLTC